MDSIEIINIISAKYKQICNEVKVSDLNFKSNMTELILNFPNDIIVKDVLDLYVTGKLVTWIIQEIFFVHNLSVNEICDRANLIDNVHVQEAVANPHTPP